MSEIDAAADWAQARSIDPERKPQIHVPISVSGVIVIEDLKVVRVSITHYAWEYDAFNRVGETDKEVIEFVDEKGCRKEYDADITSIAHSIIDASNEMDDFDTWQVEVWTEWSDRQMRP